MKILNCILFLFLFVVTNQLVADDPFDPFSYPFDFDESFSESANSDEHKSAEQLIREAILLQYDSQLLEARSKLLKALQKDPKQFTAHMALADYYSRHVGHFRLSLKYAKQAQNLLFEKYGAPPFQDQEPRAIHSDILLLLSNARLNMDDYQGALQTLTDFEQYGYDSSYLSSSKAWILMKLGRLEEAIKVARAGLIAGANPGHTLNILGILLSMTGERQAALNTFQEALRFELSLGEMGNPSTPLNNSGEVYKEIFLEDKARQSWLSAIQLPDGCEHVLPSLNLKMIYMDELNLLEAKKALDSFEACVAQFPLKNGEEHRALVKMARARIAMHSGHPEQALELLQDAADHQQWFGKIGTTIEDLQLGILMSTHAALLASNQQLRLKSYESLIDYFLSLKTRAANAIKAYWAARQARELISTKLNFLEDLFIRNTDSMLEYPSLGTLLSTFPRNVIARRIIDFQDSDKRNVAQIYYKLYLAENDLNSGHQQQALKILDAVLADLRPETDRLLKAHALALKLQTISAPKNPIYIKTSYDLLTLQPAALINKGITLSVNCQNMPKAAQRVLQNSGLRCTSTDNLPILVEFKKSDTKYELSLKTKLNYLPEVEVSANSLPQAINNLKKALFTREL